MDADSLLDSALSEARKRLKMEVWADSLSADERKMFDDVIDAFLARRSAGQTFPMAALARAIRKGFGLRVAPDTVAVYLRETRSFDG